MCIRDRGLPEGDAHVLDEVVVIDFQVALGFDGEVEETVPGEEVEHVVKEGDSSVDFGFPGTVETECEFDSRFLGFPGDGG